jgi:hypothetical protein
MLDEAIELLRETLRLEPALIETVKHDPDLDPLRATPRSRRSALPECTGLFRQGVY